MVSAHYPPNFLSGGTLVPQRSARSLAHRGYEVSVFAGWIGDEVEHPMFSAWDEDDEGVAVHWVATYFGCWDRRHFDNSEVARQFGSWLDELRPDVVHLHSLQTLGAGLVHEAADRGLPVAITLHDFWWWCARQFLCDRDFKPCCPVVDAGNCGCEVGRAWLEERNSFMSRALERADVILPVSQSAAAVAVANGADPDRVVVLEPGTDRPPTRPGVSVGASEATQPSASSDAMVRALPVSTRPPTTTGRITILYAGGSSPMKGSAVLAEAARLLAHTVGWRLICFGSELPLDAEDLPVENLPAFPPEELDQVLAGADVLVVPSVVHESYSTLTREAISHGVPVVCSSCLGPEEVVEDGLNGLVVPPADPVSLADALRGLVEDPELLPRLREGCRSIELPTVEDHVDQLVKIYDDLLALRTTRAVPAHRVSRVLFVVGIDGAPLRYRTHLPAEALASLGVHSDVRHYLHPDVERLSEDADVVVFYRVPATLQVLDLIHRLRRLTKPVVFDVDDLVFDPDLPEEIPSLRHLPEEEVSLYWQGVRRYRTTMEQCDAFIGSTELLCSRATVLAAVPAHRFANGVGRVLGRLSDEALHRPRSEGPRRIGYLSGTSTHSDDWEFVEPAVAELLETRPDIELWLVGLVQPSEMLARFGERVRRRPLLEWTELPELLRDLDVNLAPMKPATLFNEAKSPVKWLEAALTATPTVASPTQPFREVVRHGKNGMLAGDLPEWVDGVGELLDDAHLRARLGARARRDALLQFAPAVQGRRYLSILEQVRPRPASGGTTSSSSWVSVANDEPYRPMDLEPYPPRTALQGLGRPVGIP